MSSSCHPLTFLLCSMRPADSSWPSVFYVLQQHLVMPPGMAGRAASSGFRFNSPYLHVMSATTLSYGTIVALDCSDSCFRELSGVPSGKRAPPACQGLNQKKTPTPTVICCHLSIRVQCLQGRCGRNHLNKRREFWRYCGAWEGMARYRELDSLVWKSKLKRPGRRGWSI